MFAMPCGTSQIISISGLAPHVGLRLCLLWATVLWASEAERHIAVSANACSAGYRCSLRSCPACWTVRTLTQVHASPVKIEEEIYKGTWGEKEAAMEQACCSAALTRPGVASLGCSQDARPHMTFARS